MELSATLSRAPNRLRLRTLALLPLLREAKPNAWNLAWSVHRERFATEIEAARAAVKKQKAAKRPSVESLQELVFGTFVGIARDASLDLPLRQFSIRHLVRLGEANDLNRVTVQQTLVQFLSDANAPVRAQSFAALRALDTDSAQLAADCIESGRRDMGIEGLKLLTQSGTDIPVCQVLEEVALTRRDLLCLDAANMLAEQTDEVATAIPLLEAAHPKMRAQAVRWLEATYDDAKAKKALHQALGSKYRAVRTQSAIALATKQDPAAYAALLELLDTTDATNEQMSLVAALEKLGDPRTPDALLDRIEADHGNFFAGVANFRQPDAVDRLLGMMENPKLQQAALGTILTISGHDQNLPRQWKHNDESDDREWMKDQHPRHDDVLARMLTACAELNYWRHCPRTAITEAACWSLSDAVDPVLATLGQHPDESLRHAAVEAIAWRVRRRDSAPDALIAALGHKDPTTKFLAAEGLALAGRDDGMNVLLAAIDLMDDLDLRRRAVTALGELADERALEVLLKLASEDGHALQAAAAEAIGHLGKSDRAEEIFGLLNRFAKSEDHALVTRAIRGLRWFDTREGWERIRWQAQQGWNNWHATNAAVEALGDNDTPATRDVLLKLFACDADADIRMRSARKVFGEDSLEPDYAICRAGAYADESVMERLRERGEPERLFEVLPHANEWEKVQSFLLNRDPLPEAAALEALANDEPIAVSTAARILGRCKPGKKNGDRLAAIVPTWIEAWRERRDEARASSDHNASSRTRKSAETLATVAWACGRLGAGADALAACLTDLATEPEARSIRAAAVKALAEIPKPGAAALAALEAAAGDPQAEIRELALAALASHDAKRAAGLAEPALSDRGSFRALAREPKAELAAALRSGVAVPHVQAVALPFVIASGDRKPLVAAAQDAGLPEWSRLGAIEALAAMADEAAEDDLAKLGKTKALDEELRKAAWRGLRRSRRAREKAEVRA